MESHGRWRAVTRKHSLFLVKVATDQHRTATRPENKLRASEYRGRSFSPNQRIRPKFAHHHYETGFHALGAGQEVPPYPRSGSVGRRPPGHFPRPSTRPRSGQRCGRPEFSRTTERFCRRRSCLQDLGEDLAQGDAANGARGVRIGLFRVCDIDEELPPGLQSRWHEGREQASVRPCLPQSS
jgi:hypothetical protein